MPHSVKGFTNVAKHCKNFFAFVKGFTESIVYINELVVCLSVFRMTVFLSRILVVDEFFDG